MPVSPRETQPRRRLPREPRPDLSDDAHDAKRGQGHRDRRPGVRHERR